MNTSTSSGGSDLLIVVAILVLIIIYWVPTIVAVMRRNGLPNLWSIVIINAFLGWTLVGWVAALAMASRSVPIQPQYVVPPGWSPGPGQQPPGEPTGNPPGP
jgi:Superinfection immunity protein